MITAKVIQDSVHGDKRITTFELEYPRFIHSEFMTHRMFSRNGASSRAIPVNTMLNNIENNPATPIHWGKNQAGMQANEQLEGNDLVAAKSLWDRAMSQSLRYSLELNNIGVHKQIVNRITEPFQHMKTVVTATEWDNWYALRNHKDAQPEIHELAAQMLEAYNKSDPLPLNCGEWHVPYVHRECKGNTILYKIGGLLLSVEEARIVSASCCAQVSYRKSDDSLEKAHMIYDKLINMKPAHSSPFEHQATPIKVRGMVLGLTHIDMTGQAWSGNFKGWIQYRQLL